MSRYDVKQEVTDKYSLRGRVFHKLREDILNGKYKENEELKEVAIGEELGVSRTPVREAFRQLELEGLIQIVPNKGAYVTGITAKDVKDIYMIRSSLEGMCARLATEHITEEQMEELEENVYLASFHASKGHMEQMAELDNRFHHILYASCDSKMLENLFRKHPKAAMLKSLRAGHDFFFALLVRLLGVLPGDLVGAYMGASGVKYPAYLAGTVLGMLPSMITFPLMGVNIRRVGSPEFLISAGI